MHKVVKMKVNPAYKPHLTQYDKRINVFYGGAGSGKSHFVIQKIILKGLKMKRKILVIRKVGATIRDSIYALFIHILAEDLQILDICDVPKSSLYIGLPNGTQILFKGLDDSEKIKSIAGIDDIVIEEATELTLDDFSQLNLRLRSANGYNQIHLMFNPVSKVNWVYGYWFADSAVIPENTSVVHTTWNDNEFLPQEYVDSLLNMAKNNPTYYKIYALGQFATLDRLIFENYKVEQFNHIDILKRPKTKAYFGLDFGYTNDPTAFIACIVSESDKRIYIYDEFYQKELVNTDIASLIAYKGYAKEIITADAAEPKSIDEIKRYGIRRIKAAAKGRDSILNGIQFIQQYEVIIHPDCKNAIMEFENYTWKKDKKTNEYYNEPNDEFNHLIDALRYALEDARTPRKVIATNSMF